ncbi:MAG: hypothetical protein KKB30_04740 [Proteobacteria bacterium]|nr:hypothetical protein [Pseudomonadota bacterium]MBU1715486.1 hypothetical protein [Pseudomonadota bacterium]
MKKILIPTVVMLGLLLAVTAMSMGRRPDVGVVVSIPLLPPLVDLREEPYYNHSGYYYHFNNERWYYSRSKGGPWADLPRDHYPKETRYKGKKHRHDKGQDHDDRGRDDRGRDQKNDNRGHDNRR